MIKNILILLILTSSSLFSAEPDKNLHLKCLYPTVLIESIDKKNIGTGVIVVSKKLENTYCNVALTCEHVVIKENSFCYVNLCHYENWSKLMHITRNKAFVYKKDKMYDICVLIFESDKELPTVNCNFDDNFIGNEIFKIGYGNKQQARFDKGYISSINFPIEQANYYRISVFTIEGDSGGPVFNSNQELIALTKGISSDKYTKYYNINFSVPLVNFDNLSDVSFLRQKTVSIPKYPVIFCKLSELKSDKDIFPIDFLFPKIKIFLHP